MFQKAVEFTVVTITTPWYCGRNVGYSYRIL